MICSKLGWNQKQKLLLTCQVGTTNFLQTFLGWRWLRTGKTFGGPTLQIYCIYKYISNYLHISSEFQRLITTERETYVGPWPSCFQMFQNEICNAERPKLLDSTLCASLEQEHTSQHPFDAPTTPRLGHCWLNGVARADGPLQPSKSLHSADWKQLLHESRTGSWCESWAQLPILIVGNILKHLKFKATKTRNKTK